MACNLDSRLGQLEEQGKTMVDATRRLLETVNAVKDTGELLLQIIENHQKMLEMSRRVENLINDAKMKVKWHYGPIFFKPEKNLEFFRLKHWPIDAYPGKFE